LLPVLSMAKQQALRTQCINNQKELGLANAMYASDFKDWIAFCNWDNGQALIDPVTGQDGVGWLYVCNGSIPSPFSAFYKNNPVKCWQKGAWWPYVKNQNSYLCPVDIKNRFYKPDPPIGRANKLCSYEMNGAAAGFPEPQLFQSTKISAVWNPTCYLFWEPYENPTNTTDTEFNDASNYPETPVSYPSGNEGIGPLHDKNGGNISRLDGSSVFITTQQFNTASQTSGPVGRTPRTLLWWSTYTADGKPVGY